MDLRSLPPSAMRMPEHRTSTQWPDGRASLRNLSSDRYLSGDVPTKACFLRTCSQEGFAFKKEPKGFIYNGWHLRCKGRMTGGKGCKAGRYLADGEDNYTLYQTAIRKIALLMQSEPHTFDFSRVPWSLIRPVYDYMIQRDLVSLETWKIFAAAYGQDAEDDINGLKDYKMNAHIVIHEGTWSRQLDKIASPSLIHGESAGPLVQSPMPALASKMQFLVFLEASYALFDRLDLLFLPQIPNLGMLSLGPGMETENNPRGIDEAIFRSWARQADTVPDAFRALRTLQIVQADPVTMWTMASLNRLPSLSFVTFLCRCWGNALPELKQHARRNGWVIQSPRLLLANSGEGRGRPRDMYKSHDRLHAAQDVGEAKRCNNLPLLHFQLVGSGWIDYSPQKGSKDGAVSFVRGIGDICGIDSETTTAEEKKRRREEVEDDLFGQRQVRRSKLRDNSENIWDLLLG